jgi:hypothetical protein
MDRFVSHSSSLNLVKSSLVKPLIQSLPYSLRLSFEPSISTTTITKRSKPSICNSAELVTEFQHSHAVELHYPFLSSALSFGLGITHKFSVLLAPCLLGGCLSLAGVTTPTQSTSGPFQATFSLQRRSRRSSLRVRRRARPEPLRRQFSFSTWVAPCRALFALHGPPGLHFSMSFLAGVLIT